MYFIFIFISPPVSRSAVKMSVKSINKKLKAHMENKINYYKICDIKYGIRFLFHKVFCLKLLCLNIL